MEYKLIQEQVAVRRVANAMERFELAASDLCGLEEKTRKIASNSKNTNLLEWIITFH